MYGQLNIFDLTMPRYQIIQPIRLIELFAGIGAQAMALRDLGVDFGHYRVVESDRFAVGSYNAIHGTDFRPSDIREVDGKDLGIENPGTYCYVMTYSFPCQDLSLAGKHRGMGKGGGTRSGLLWEVGRLLDGAACLPQVLLTENVPQVHSRKHMPDFGEWACFLAAKGYTNYWQDLNAKDYGVAQNRKRCFMVSILGAYNYKFPGPRPLEKTMEDYLEDEVDEKYYINTDKAREMVRDLAGRGGMDNRQRICVDLSETPQEREIANCITRREDRSVSSRKSIGNGVIEWKRKLGNIYGFGGGNYAGYVYDKAGISPTIRTCQGGNQQPIIVAMRGRNPENPSDRTPGSPTEQRIEPNSRGICNTLSSVLKDSMALEASGRLRKLTPLECWRLMGFTDSDFARAAAVNSNAQLYKQAGNSIVKDVLMAVFGQMIGGVGDSDSAHRCR